mgnify:FL=1|tara:strand:+ start:215 stop:904 length:690 start_codon:yes stop_codon:yes gene_type:complete
MSSKLTALTKFHKELNPELWKNNQLDLQVRYKLLQIALEFIKYINIDDLDLEDITISGSNCSFNYTPQSDIDLHLVVDSSSPCWPHLQELYMAKKSLFNDNHDITIQGQPVEVYVQDSQQQHFSNGIFSVLNNQWKKKPQPISAKIDRTNVLDKYRDVKRQLQKVIKNGDQDEMKNMQEKLRNMRKQGLAKHGEFGTENLVFKLLRRDGSMDRLWKKQQKTLDNHLSLD